MRTSEFSLLGFLVQVSLEFEVSLRPEHVVEEQDGYLEASGFWVTSDGDIPVAVVEFDLEATDGLELTLAVTQCRKNDNELSICNNSNYRKMSDMCGLCGFKDPFVKKI